VISIIIWHNTEGCTVVNLVFVHSSLMHV